MAAETNDEEAVITVSETNWRPPRAGSALAVAIVAVVCWLLAEALGVLDSLAVATVGGTGIAAVVWLAGRERFAALGTLLGVAVAPLAGSLLLAGLGYTLIAQLAGFAPQGTAFVGMSVVLAGFGAASIPNDSVNHDGVSTATWSALLSAVGLLTVTGALIGNTARRKEEMEPFADLPLPETMPELIPEATAVPPLGSFLLIASLALLALRAALAALPAAELLDDRAGDNDAAIRWFEQLQSALGRATIGVIVGIPLVGARILLGPAYVELWASLPPTVVSLLDGLARAPFLRWLATRLLVGGVIVVMLVRLIRRLHRVGVRKHLGKIAIVAGTALAFAAGWMGHDLILNTLTGRLETALPGSVAEVVLQQIDSVIEYYTGEVVALGLVALGGVTAGLSLAMLRLGMLFQVVPGRHSGHALASAGLLAAGGFGAALGAPLLESLGALVGAVVVWDLGRFGVSLGRDVGRRAPSLPVQFVRVLTATLIGAVTAAFGLAAVSMTPVSIATESAAAVALFAAVGVAFLASLVLAR
ncbi:MULTISPECIES: DUF7519 family protein [Halolamina]|uniref:Uncharacterized protein n=1 Tax=Halolamina pelagica TaxID=699431 RepID=A0A1I5VT54_9EURY|nr:MULTISPECIES: hypothetical protein [Halolamina]NHX37853.1 hypothetical protein [Halolamina sp. R1-12]SFQ10652.1 hypothetical protein SAMN05216277_1204 [Halolamina pelagica]